MRILKIIAYFLICILAAQLIPRAELQAASVIPGWHTTIFPAQNLLGTLLTLLSALQFGLTLAMLLLKDRMPYRPQDMAQVNLWLAVLNTPLAVSGLLSLLVFPVRVQTFFGGHVSPLIAVLSVFVLLFSFVVLLLPQLFWWPRFQQNARFTLIVVMLILGFSWGF